MCLCVFRCAALPPPIHRPERIILHGLLCVRPGHQSDWPLPQHHCHAHPLQRVRCHVQYSLHHPIQPDSRVPAGRAGTRFTDTKKNMSTSKVKTERAVCSVCVCAKSKSFRMFLLFGFPKSLVDIMQRGFDLAFFGAPVHALWAFHENKQC